MGKDGFKNEELLLNTLDNKKFKDLNKNLQNMIKYIHSSISENTIIKASKKGGSNKADLLLEIENNTYYISIKKGTGNSIHQEKLEEFIKFLEETYNIKQELADNIRFFIWGDGSLDGNEKDYSKRMNVSQIKKEYPEVIFPIKKFFYSHKNDLIKRFLLKGPKSLFEPDYFYYGTPEKGICLSSDYVFNWLKDDSNEPHNAPIPVGRFTFQAWNRNINGGEKSEQKRGVIQLKWSSIGKDFELMKYQLNKKNKNIGTIEGTEEEILFVKKLNKKDDITYWNVMNLNPMNNYAIHVISKKYSRINGKKVLPKADIYIATGNLSEKDLKTKNYYLNEKDVETFKLKPILNTGISVKLPNSNNYQITKMVPETFKNIFGSYELGAGASIYSLKEKDLEKNLSVITGWNITYDQFIKFFKKESLNINNKIDITTAKSIKKYSIKKIEEKILNDPKISQFIFQGIGNFEEPFTVYYLYESGIFKDSCTVPFYITTGSGRSKGKYSIEIKPKKIKR